jgi:undecaprenyl-diphosphatase
MQNTNSAARWKDRYRLAYLVRLAHVRSVVRSIIEYLGSHGIVVLGALLVLVAGTWGFIALLDEVKEGDTQHFDDWAVRTLGRYHDIRWLEEVGRDFTALGGVAVLSLFTLAVVGFLLLVRKYGAMWLVLIAVVGGQILSTTLKYFIDRPRPDLVPHLAHVYTTSFPSGHSMMSAVVYLTLGSLLAQLVKTRVLKFYFLSVAMLLTFLVGVSRVYMGVHWPTDVLAGWTAGLVWAILCWLVARQLQRRNVVEQSVEPPEDLDIDVKD